MYVYKYDFIFGLLIRWFHEYFDSTNLRNWMLLFTFKVYNVKAQGHRIFWIYFENVLFSLSRSSYIHLYPQRMQSLQYWLHQTFGHRPTRRYRFSSSHVDYQSWNVNLPIFPLNYSFKGLQSAFKKQLYYIHFFLKFVSCSAHRTTNFTNPEFQYPQFKCCKVFLFYFCKIRLLSRSTHHKTLQLVHDIGVSKNSNSNCPNSLFWFFLMILPQTIWGKYYIMI